MNSENPRSLPTLRTCLSAALIAMVCLTGKGTAADRPNIVFPIADDWGWPHAGMYGDRKKTAPGGTATNPTAPATASWPSHGAGR